VDDDIRNRAICDEIVESVGDGRSPLILTERNEHLDRLEDELATKVPHVVVLRGGMGKKQRQAAADRLAAILPEEGRVILATGNYIGEGFDDARLDTLFLTLPVSWRGTIAQYVGRLHRLYEGKREVRVYDYADLNVPMLARMFDRRCRGYEAVGYTIVLPASAIPGWPSDVPLPADPSWKRDYAASVRRLVRDGVDAPLGNLFVTAARPISSEAEGADRARSASEGPRKRSLFQLESQQTEDSARCAFNRKTDATTSRRFSPCRKVHSGFEPDAQRACVPVRRRTPAFAPRFHGSPSENQRSQTTSIRIVQNCAER
jgi:superfamily II DNA or RNA helicase